MAAGDYITGVATLPADRTNQPGRAAATTTYELDAAFANALKAAIQDCINQGKSYGPALSMYSGADPAGKTDSYQAINTALTGLDAAGGGTLFVDGNYLTSHLITLPVTCSLWLAPNASIKATAAMEAVIQSPLTSLIEDKVIRGGRILCNALANVGIDLQWCKANRIEDIEVEDFLVAGYRLGNASAPSNSYENRVTNARTHRRTATVVANSIGLHLRASTDNLISDCVFIGGETGVQVDSTAAASMFSNVHCWVNLGRMKYGFNDSANSTSYVNCYPDSPSVYGWWLQGQYTQIQGGRHYNNNAVGDDNVAIGIRVEQAAPFHSIANVHFWGQDNTHRIKQDIQFASASTNVSFIGPIQTNVVTSTGPQTGGIFKGQSSISARGFTNYNSAGSNRDIIFQTSSGGAGIGTRWILRCDSTTESGSNAGSNYLLLGVHDDGTTTVQLMEATRAGALGFYTAAPVAQQTVTGSKGANAALTNLMTALAALGLVVDGTT